MGKFTALARKFHVWREGNAVNWDTTYVALAKATDIDVGTVRSICKSAGWKCRYEDELPPVSHIVSVDSYMDMPDCPTRRGLA